MLTDHRGQPLRLLLVHAHPDDETTTTGATIARYVAEGVGVTLVTCTRGERGERVDEPDHADPGGDEAAEALGQRRVGELAVATAALGVTDVQFLGGPGRWWDSGMAGSDTVNHPRSFATGPLDEQCRQLVAVIRAVRPQVVVTYDERGGYGHPDHVRAHDVTIAAFDAAGDADVAPDLGTAWQPQKLYAAVVPYSSLRAVMALMSNATIDGENPFATLAAAGGGEADGGGATDDVGADPATDLPFGVPDEAVTARIDARPWLPAKGTAMRAHRSQMHANGWFFALVDAPGQGFGIEHFRLLRGTSGGPVRPERDVFAGLRAAEAGDYSTLEVAHRTA